MTTTENTKNKKIVKIIVLAVLGIFLCVVPLFTGSYAETLMTNIFMYIILTVGWTLFCGPTGYTSLGTGAFFGVGIYIAAIFGNSLPIPVLVIFGGACGFILAVIVGAITLRLRGIYFAIFTFGLVELIKHLVLWWEVNIMRTRGRFVVAYSEFQIYYVMFAIMVVLLFVAWFIKHSKFGLALESIGQYEEAAIHIGINTTRVKTLGFAIGSFFMAAAGVAIATRWTYIDPYIAFNTLYSFMPPMMSLFGGAGALWGPVVGAGLFTWLEEMLITRFPYYYMLIFGTVLVLVILFMRNGLVGVVEKIRKRGK